MQRTYKEGFTLLETLIYTAMVGVIMVGVIMLAVVTLEVRGKVRAAIILEENYRLALNRITAMVNQADDMTYPSIGVKDSEMQLAMSDSLLDPTVINLQDGVIYVQQGTGEAVALTSAEIDISELSIERASTTVPMVRIVVHGRLRDSHPSFPDLSVTTTAVIKK